jgi:predicted enzyme related to lactoylglutathione lyase
MAIFSMMQISKTKSGAVLLMLGLVGSYTAATADDEALIVSPISAVPSNEIHNGELVWVDLITTDPQKAVEFYSSVFNWQAHTFADENYIELSHNGRVISSVVRYDDDEAEEGDSRWLVSISVSDVDAATQNAVESGGAILEAATDLPDRGRYSVISDSQGAVLMLLRATGGDPTDDTQFLNEWSWAELWTNDTQAAVDFYHALAGYDAMRFPDADGGERILLGTDGKARATVVPLPWDDVEPNWIPYNPVANAADTMQRIVDAGGTVLEKAGSDDESVTVAIVMGPTGGVFAIQEVGSQQ